MTYWSEPAIPLRMSSACAGSYPYDVSADGQRFLDNTLVEQQQTTSAAITLVVNWPAGLNK